MKWVVCLFIFSHCPIWRQFRPRQWKLTPPPSPISSLSASSKQHEHSHNTQHTPHSDTLELVSIGYYTTHRHTHTHTHTHVTSDTVAPSLSHNANGPPWNHHNASPPSGWIPRTTAGTPCTESSGSRRHRAASHDRQGVGECASTVASDSLALNFLML